jgi:superfamily II DNA or RNA helicase
MAADITISKLNCVYNKVKAEPGIAEELKEYFRFRPDGYRFVPAFKNKWWDGYINMYRPLQQTLYCGITYLVDKFAEQMNYTVEWEDLQGENEFSEFEAREFIKTINLPEKYTPKDHQIRYFVKCVRQGRGLVISPTGSGKSLIIYLLIRYYGVRTLLIVPTIGLVKQMKKDLISYGCSEKWIHTIAEGAEKESLQPITISTWQSIYKLKKDWFDKYGTVIGDEAHLYEAKSLVKIMENLTECRNRFGTTGTLSDGAGPHPLVLQGLFGKIIEETTTSELMELGELAKLKVQAIVLVHTEAQKEQMKYETYDNEMKYLCSSIARNNFIANLTLSLKGNILILYRFVEGHGKILHDLLKSKAPQREIHFVSGEVGGDDREQIRQWVIEGTNTITVASFGTFSTGIDIPNLDVVIAASPYKSRVKVLQSIGRGVRKYKDKVCTWYDIADDLTWRKWKNHTLKHFAKRIMMYAQQKFDYKIYKVQLKGKR